MVGMILVMWPVWLCRQDKSVQQALQSLA